MKKLFTLICAIVGFAGVANAADVNDLKQCKHSYVLVCDEWNNDGTEKIAKGALYGDDFFFTPTGHDKATNKKSVDLSNDSIWGADIATKYGEYGTHLNSLRIKNAQDVFAMKVTAGSKVIIFFNGQGKTGKDARFPKIATSADLTQGVQTSGYLMSANADGFLEKTNFDPTTFETTDAINVGKLVWTAPDDMTIYVGSYGGDTYVSYVIVEANEAPGTPMVKVGNQTFENGLWFKEVTCKAMPAEEDGMTTPTVVTYTTDGTEPTMDSPKYTAPIKCYQDMIVKFQAYLDIMEDGTILDEDCKCIGADNEGIVSFSFNAPTLTVDGGNVSIASEYEGAKNFYSYGDVADAEGDNVTLTESATFTAYTQIPNGSYTTFTTKSVTKDVYVLNPIKEKKVVEVVSGDVVLDEAATATSTTGPVYVVENGELSTDKMEFFVKDLVLKGIMDEQYQVEGRDKYIQMSNTNITFVVAEGDSVNVKVTCSKNSCKTMFADDNAEPTADQMCMVNVSGTNYGDTLHIKDGVITGNVIEFGLPAGTYTFQKYSGTGNIFIGSIVIEPAAKDIPGDQDNDGDVNIGDYTIVANYILADESPAKADVNGDGGVDVGDLTAIANIILYSESQAPASAKPRFATDPNAFDNVIYMKDATAKAGDEIEIPVYMKNSVGMTGFQFDVVMPEGLSVAMEDDYYLIDLSTERTTARNTNTFDSAKQLDGSVRVLAGSTKSKTIEGNDGEVAIITANVAAGLADGEYKVVLKNIIMSDATGKTYKVDSSEATITVASATGISNVNANALQNGKFVKDGRLVIVKANKLYNIDATSVK